LDQELVYSPVLALHHRVIITTFSGAAFALDIRDGKEIWSRRFTRVLSENALRKK
ncbi:MAG: PQQ-binding-like beta-propeller repeat protein, partial [Proteobacteria bacterium]|nr:PQQ-binding-like beta-propeller repeat protein [Pseudomonadota bacterium]